MQLPQMRKPTQRSDWTDLFLESAHARLSFAMCNRKIKNLQARESNLRPGVKKL